jgi:hypothetical protein
MLGKQKVIVSLTTISTRLPTLSAVVESLFNQTHKADHIVLNISLDSHLLDQGIRFEQLPETIRKIAVAGELEVYFCKNTGPYRKIMPVLERFGDEDYFIATADDDVLYPPEWLEVLLKTALTHRCIAAYRCRLMQRAGSGFTPYGQWPLLRAEQTPLGMDILPTGRDGVLYHASHFQDREALRALMALAPMQDDVALRFTTLASGIPVAVAPRQLTSMPGDYEFQDASHTDEALWVLNYKGRNDQTISACADWVRQHRPVKLAV